MSMLEIQHLSTDFETENGMVHAVRDVSLSVDKGEVLGIRFRKESDDVFRYGAAVRQRDREGWQYHH